MAIWSILRLFGIVCDHLVHLWLFGIFSILVHCTNKNLATLVETEIREMGDQVLLEDGLDVVAVVEEAQVEVARRHGRPQPGVDFRKPFRPKVTDKTSNGSF
jgi:hypothetical protein